MSFYGTELIYDGKNSGMFGLMVAEVGNASQESGSLGGKLTIHEDRIDGRATGLHYGATANEALSFPIGLVAQKDNHHFDRYELAAIAGWLAGHRQYGKLSICQPDLEGVYFRAIITELSVIERGMRAIGVEATVTCDGPYAYRWMEPTTLEVAGSGSCLYRNGSNVNDYYRPVLTIQCSGDSFQLRNERDGGVFSLTGLGSGVRTITVDSQNQVMVSSDGTDLYGCWNQGADKWMPRFVRGDNPLTLTGTGTVTVENTWPWNVGF